MCDKDFIVFTDDVTEIIAVFAFVAYGSVKNVAVRFEDIFDKELEPFGVAVEFFAFVPFDGVISFVWNPL